MSLEVLAKRWTTAKDLIKSLQEELEEIEAEMLPLLESKEGGSKTTQTEFYKITVKRPLYFSFDKDNWPDIRVSIPYDLAPVKTKEEVDEAGLKWLQENKPEVYAKVSLGIVCKPGKASFTIKPVTEEE